MQLLKLRHLKFDDYYGVCRQRWRMKLKTASWKRQIREKWTQRGKVFILMPRHSQWLKGLRRTVWFYFLASPRAGLWHLFFANNPLFWTVCVSTFCKFSPNGQRNCRLSCDLNYTETPCAVWGFSFSQNLSRFIFLLLFSPLWSPQIHTDNGSASSSWCIAALCDVW